LIEEQASSEPKALGAHSNAFGDYIAESVDRGHDQSPAQAKAAALLRERCEAAVAESLRMKAYLELKAAAVLQEDQRSAKEIQHNNLRLRRVSSLNPSASQIEQTSFHLQKSHISDAEKASGKFQKKNLFRGTGADSSAFKEEVMGQTASAIMMPLFRDVSN
jgi:hypothetical protein